jgi:predicted lipoprotein with Yx(FWY)xxD motif
MRIQTTFLPILALIALASVAACTNVAATPPPASQTASPTAAATASPEESSPSTTSATVMVADSNLGKILVDGQGRTLYGFTPDEAGTPTCYDACKATWPPLLAEGDITVGAGLDDSAFSTVARTDSGNQVKVSNWPLYYFASDAAPGDTNGQGVAGKWYVVSPTGTLIK